MREVFLVFFITYIYAVIVLSLVLAVQAAGAWMLLRTRWARSSRSRRMAIYAAAPVSFCVMILGFLLRFARVNRYFPAVFSNWTRNAALTWAVLSGLLILMFAISRLIPPPTRESGIGRRRFLLALRAAAVAAPAVVFGYGTFIERNSVELHEESIPIAGLHPDLDGLRLVQLSDIHLSPFLSEKVLARAVAMANETRAHLALVTGDLISFTGDPLDTCLDRLAKLKAGAGIFGCLGNHEVYAQVEEYVTERGARLGMRFLRSVAEPLRFGAATLNLAGVDYQRMHSKYLIGAETMIRRDPDGRTLNLLLSHNPDVFPVAASQGWQFTLAGHTHGGQVNVEILRQDLNVARFFTPYTVGQYRLGEAAIYVSRGIGTIGAPIRLGSVPEVALLTLRRA
jgi:predicted MPP superfamily phosphohydrolase